MARHETVNLETVIGLAEKLSAVEKLKLVERVLVDLEPIVRAQESEKRKLLRHTSKRQTLTEEKIKEIKRKLWGADEQQWPNQIVRLEGLWKDMPLNLTAKEFRRARQELSEALKLAVAELISHESLYFHPHVEEFITRPPHPHGLRNVMQCPRCSHNNP